MVSDCSSMHGICQSEKDNWTGIKDPKKRKQIQDRLAQRARRKRLAEAKANSDNQSSSSSSTTNKTELAKQTTTSKQSPANVVGIWDTNNSEVLSFMPIPINVYSALWHNGHLLGLTCTAGLSGMLSTPRGPEIPESLHPTDLQLSYVHPPWIDRFPFPKMRDNVIMLLGFIDTEEFLYDLFNGPSFVLEAGGESWDPKVWSVDEKWKGKWGFLFDEDLFSVPSLLELEN